MAVLEEREDMLGTFWVDPELSVNGGLDGRIVYCWVPFLQMMTSPEGFYEVPSEDAVISLADARMWIQLAGHTIMLESSSHE